MKNVFKKFMVVIGVVFCLACGFVTLCVTYYASDLESKNVALQQDLDRTNAEYDLYAKVVCDAAEEAANNMSVSDRLMTEHVFERYASEEYLKEKYANEMKNAYPDEN